MKKLALIVLALAAGACAPMRHPATLGPQNAPKAQTAQPGAQQQTAQPQAPAPATN